MSKQNQTATGVVNNINTFSDILNLVGPYVTIGLTIGIVIFILKIAKFWGTAEEKLNKTDKIDSAINKINENISTINGTLTLMESRINKMEGGFTQTQSPLNLTEKGKLLADEENLYVSLNTKWNEIRVLITENCKTKNPYDIQEYILNKTMLHIELFLDDEGLDNLKRRAYKEGVPLQVLSRVIGVIVRNRYFEENGINKEEVDRFDPSKND